MFAIKMSQLGLTRCKRFARFPVLPIGIYRRICRGDRITWYTVHMLTRLEDLIRLTSVTGDGLYNMLT